jgi:hypothetical protein
LTEPILFDVGQNMVVMQMRGKPFPLEMEEIHLLKNILMPIWK